MTPSTPVLSRNASLDGEYNDVERDSSRTRVERVFESKARLVVRSNISSGTATSTLESRTRKEPEEDLRNPGLLPSPIISRSMPAALWYSWPRLMFDQTGLACPASPPRLFSPSLLGNDSRGSHWSLKNAAISPDQSVSLSNCHAAPRSFVCCRRPCLYLFDIRVQTNFISISSIYPPLSPLKEPKLTPPIYRPLHGLHRRNKLTVAISMR